MRPFIPAICFAVLTFPMLLLWTFFSGASSDLEPWLFLARLVAWLASLCVTFLLFSPAILHRRLGFRGSLALSSVAVLAYYSLLVFLTGLAEQHVIQQRIASGYSSDSGPTYMYAEFSGSGYAHGRMPLLASVIRGVGHGLSSAFIWFTVVFLVARRLYLHAAPQPNSRNAS